MYKVNECFQLVFEIVTGSPTMQWPINGRSSSSYLTKEPSFQAIRLVFTSDARDAHALDGSRYGSGTPSSSTLDLRQSHMLRWVRCT